MATSTIAQVLDLSLAKLNGLLPFALPQGSEPVYIIDGSPGQAEGVQNLITVMPLPEDESRGTEDWEDTSKARIENYDIQIHIWAYIGGGPDPNTLSAAQQQARANATVMESAIEAAFLADPNLSIQQGDGSIPITQLLIAGVGYNQTNVTEDDGKGRYAQYDLVLHIYNYLAGPS